MATEASDLTPLLEQLEDSIDDIEEVLEPLLERGLTATAQKLPLLDKAKLHVLLSYSIESLIFSNFLLPAYLRLNDVDAKEHPVFRELNRVRQYHEKIKTLEAPPEKRTMTLDTQAAGRFIKHGLAGNDKYDLERAEREAKEKAMAQLRAAQLAKMKAKVAATVPQKRSVEESEMSGRDSTAVSTPEPKKSRTTDPEDDDEEDDEEEEDEGEEDGEVEEEESAEDDKQGGEVKEEAFIKLPAVETSKKNKKKLSKAERKAMHGKNGNNAAKKRHKRKNKKDKKAGAAQPPNNG
ncbi:exosome-associated family protein [Trichophyton verrucosum HKI 0517]|uniref:Exosome complex protein n=1 Tax=Trichophyton verrucosum (strain HKI 0517) TaxID=663202 RepID=D4D4L2_TRIVH|nr:exosome-associated family protein [Trichophyton verrucosum HKI 0517]EFE43214.1 exosome-associated family protein [Trichophyton verrucosum HKI 0517]